MIPILTYHHIAEPPTDGENPALFVPPQNFRDQLVWLKQSGTPVLSLDELAAALRGDGSWGRGGRRLPRRAAVITFDDGFADNYDAALPMLQEFGFPATFFITTGWIGGENDRGHRCMTEDQLRGLVQAGMTVGAHSVTHPWLAKIDREQARREMADSKKRLEEITRAPVRWFCYPSGSFDAELEATARQLGFVGACSVIRDNRQRADQLYRLPRVMVMHDTPLQRFRYYFSPLYHWLHRRKNKKRWGEYA